MTLYQYNALDELEQLEAIWEFGVLVAERTEGSLRYRLYQIDGFYVEEQMNTEDKIRLALKSFASTNAAIMQPYLEQIDLRGLEERK